MRIEKKTITHYFCIAPQSYVRGYRSGENSPLTQFLSPTVGPQAWQKVIGTSPTVDAVVIGDYEDGSKCDLLEMLHKIGIMSCPDRFSPADPSLFFRVASSPSQQQVVLGIAFRLPEGSGVMHGDGPAEIV